MDSDKFILIDKKLVSDMLFGEDKYIAEFAEASIQSFNEFSKNYRKYLIQGDLENFRRAGHKIKPVAQMLHLNQILEEYEDAKKMLKNESAEKKLHKSANKITRICDQVVQDFKLMQKI